MRHLRLLLEGDKTCMITVNFYGYPAPSGLPELVEVDGKLMRIAKGSLAAPEVAAEILEKEHNFRRERFIEEILEMATKGIEEAKRDV